MIEMQVPDTVRNMNHYNIYLGYTRGYEAIIAPYLNGLAKFFDPHSMFGHGGHVGVLRTWSATYQDGFRGLALMSVTAGSPVWFSVSETKEGAADLLRTSHNQGTRTITLNDCVVDPNKVLKYDRFGNIKLNQ